MQGLRFEYHEIVLTPEMQRPFERAVNKHFSGLCEALSSSSSYILVYWYEPHRALRGIVVTGVGFIDFPQLQNLGKGFEWREGHGLKILRPPS